MKLQINKLDLWNAGSRLRDDLADLGIVDVRLSHDLGDLERLVATLEKNALGEHFRTSLHTVPPNNVMWIQAIGANGKTAGMVAARNDVIGSWSLQRYIQEHFHRCIAGVGGKPAKLSPLTAPFVADVYGNCAYLGEGYVEPDWRKNGLSTLLVRYLMLMAWDEWRPSLIYGWMRHKHAITGMAVDWGFTHNYGGALIFDDAPADPEWQHSHFVGCGSEGVYQLIQNLTRGPHSRSSTSKE